MDAPHIGAPSRASVGVRLRCPLRRYHNMRDAMIKAVILDFGRVISAQKPLSLFHRYEVDLGLPLHTINAIMFDNPTWQDALLGHKTEAEFWDTIGPELGLHSRGAIEAFRRRYRHDEALNTNVVELIRRLHAHHKTAVLSNAPQGLREWLEDWGILDLFDLVFCSGDEGLAKPDPAVFQAVLTRLDVAPAEAVFVDDTLAHVLAAEGLGLRGVLFTTAEALAEQLADIL
jgi:epoxide hydrolase-like predicted phosphatase